ncbi:hypothetical protein THAOC_09280, partial [Thalassiosira oceanica]
DSSTWSPTEPAGPLSALRSLPASKSERAILATAEQQLGISSIGLTLHHFSGRVRPAEGFELSDHAAGRTLDLTAHTARPAAPTAASQGVSRSERPRKNRDEVVIALVEGRIDMLHQAAGETEDEPSESVHTSLIQTYLGLLCYENATFLAERYAAAFPNSENAVYLLAYCYYRSGSPKSARSVLLSRWLSRNNVSSVLKSADVDLERTRSSARYLLAKCCVELGYYGEAEEVLVRHAREKFSRVVDKNAGIVNGVKINGNWSEAMDAWIIQEARPCPIPNGAAGLNLLGLICRKTNRNQRSIEYHRMALKLDPLMWTSYEAICELSGPVGSSTEADDPNSIFGVPAPVLSPRNEENALGAQHNFFRAGKSRTTRASLGGERLQHS